MQPTYMRSVSFWGMYSWSSRISASRTDVLNVPISGDHKHRMNSILKLRYRHGLPLKLERRPGTRERRKSSLSRRLQLKPCRSSAVDYRLHFLKEFSSVKSKLSLASLGRQPNKKSTCTKQSIHHYFLSILSLGMYFSAICLIFCAFYIRSDLRDLIANKFKAPQVSDACAPGVWTCSFGKRSEIAKVEDIFQMVERRAAKSYPPIWTRDELEETEQLTSKEDPESSPPGMWLPKKKRILKQMLKTALKTSQQHGGLEAKVNPSQVANDACPPGFWTCSTGKRSEISNEGQVQAPVLHETSSNIIIKKENSARLERRPARRSCPPGMWVCNGVKTN